ncbi:hypothetical protein TRFO_17203 [Tritrichomonas foetus]|uniref:Uncharacterized protein n=1 Tax=Tritrichomonas foetus TaxID=1144522 RepID=A0A1J4KSR0_9EUKA|nr:hypothetical protein TRFO_17203 [Tritrichomonas foetus]|eukprot:OHT12836.1 hypothetical protein TRFO_17203 [Tritrichomonas foetus]
MIIYSNISMLSQKSSSFFFSKIMMNLSLVSLIISGGSHSPLFAHTARYSSASSYSTLTLTKSLFTRQYSPIVFTKNGAPLNLNVIDCEFSRFLDSAIQLNSAFGNWIDQDRTTDCSTDENCNPVVTCPHAQLINTKFHDFSSDRSTGAAFGAMHDTMVTVDRCSFWNVYCTVDNGNGILFTDVEQPVNMTSTCFSKCCTRLASKSGRIHSFNLMANDTLTISQCSVFKCGEDQLYEVAVCGGGNAMNIEKFNSSYNAVILGGSCLIITHKAINTIKMQFLHFQDCGYYNTHFKIGPVYDLTDNNATFSIDNSNFINIKTDAFLDVESLFYRKISYSYSLDNCVFILHEEYLESGTVCPIYASSIKNLILISVTNCVSNCEWSGQSYPKPAGWMVEANPTPLKIEGLLGTGNTCNPYVIPVTPEETPEQPTSDPPVETPEQPTPDLPEQKTPNPDESPDKPKTAGDENENTGIDDGSQENGSKLSIGEIAGIVIGVLVVVGIVIGVVVLIKVRKAAKVSSSAGNDEDV